MLINSIIQPLKNYNYLIERLLKNIQISFMHSFGKLTVE
ncbi:hypothetical protein NARC_10283 [Candidatus Nitrosocosmicus arcticus]|uniref:Uncharacterized protein n=1 Tax=Candidatus Nitrosocosmicus arcticus TaxID=2035267 RepID=A0A557SZ48_9ARCH|nr:hypothetical protein NARC_10283 [Candidatus Nitrosocosmicus arcticus]